ncbi:MAG: ATP-grasp domain-containing protein [Candidatus Omnitrophica bacterium]|nr:ATP-grasp domain-containing protein [Candidatus Omnitrophota bacterium]MCM8798266.1 ATP-grasp domain-containing protein [Candidatus Omnitrophota bacterium]
MGKIVGLTYDLREDYTFKEDDPPDANAEFDHQHTIEAIEEALRKGGNRVVRIGNVYNLLKKLEELRLDIVFNIAEGIYGRNRESQVPIILELKGIPFVGSDGLTLGVTLDKLFAKKIFFAEGIPTPRCLEIAHPDRVKKIKLNFPLIVKPRYEGSSKGLSVDSVVKDIKSLRDRIDYIVRVYKQPALIEEFIKGKEFTVVVLGNNPPQALPPVQISIDGKLDLGENIYTFAHIRSDSLKYICPAKISSRLRKKIENLAVAVYRATECRDFGRVDIRVDEKNNPFVLEMNPLPSLSWEDVFPLVAKEMGWEYSEIINRILNYALERYGLL